jgi:hypothetical protein
MKENSFLSHLKTSRFLRLGFEILISFVFFSWLPLIPQICAGVVFSLLCEIIFARILVQSLKTRFSSNTSFEIRDRSKSL